MHDFPTSSVGPCGTSSELGAAFPVASRVRDTRVCAETAWRRVRAWLWVLRRISCSSC